MNDKTSLILGGSGGIGFSVAKLLASQKGKVCLTYNKNKTGVKEKLGKYKINADLFELDIRNHSEVDSLISEIINNYPNFNSLIFSVSAIIDNKKVEDLEWEDFQTHIDIQLKGMFNVIKALKSHIKTNLKFKCVVILTEYCFGNPPSMLSHYISSKYALMGFTKSMAIELSKTNITINMISPGMVDTNLISHLPPKLIEIEAHRNPMGRIAETVDIAKVVSFLLSDSSDYLNGVNIPVNGGNKIY